jgi:DNA modification methylase
MVESLAEGTSMARPKYVLDQPRTEVYVGDCRKVLQELPGNSVDLIFADPPFNWDVPYGEWNDAIPREDYLRFTYEWLDGCLATLSDRGAFWVNIPDDTAAEIVVHLKLRGLVMINWCIWHFRFGQHRTGNFIVSKVHALYFARNREKRTWNPEAVLEPSDRAAIYDDPRTRQTRQPGLRVPLDVWYGPNWGRIQGNNKERRPNHQNQIPEVYMERVIRACSNEGDLVLDPFLGSGTTGTIARALGRRSIGIEYSSKNAGSAFERIRRGPIRLQGTAAESNSFMKFRKRGANSHDRPEGISLFDALESNPAQRANQTDENH